MEPVKTMKIIKRSLIAVVVLIGLLTTVYTIDAGERGIVIRFGEVKSIQAEGLHMKMPFVDNVRKFSIRTNKVERQASSSSQDLQIVTTQIALNYNIEQGAVKQIYTEYKTQKALQADKIDPAIQDAVKASTAQFNAEELITKRTMVKELMEQDLKERLQSVGITVTAMNIVDFKFSNEFDKAIEQKVTAEQNALKAENDLKKVQFESEQRIVQAEAEAEAIRIQAQAINSQGGADYVQLQAIEKWNGILPTQMIPNGALPILNLR